MKKYLAFLLDTFFYWNQETYKHLKTPINTGLLKYLQYSVITALFFHTLR